MAREHPIGEPDENNEPHENDGEEGGGETIHVHETGRGGGNSGENIRPNNPSNIPTVPHTNPDAPRPELGGGGNALSQGNITIRGSAPPPAEDGKAYAIAGTIIGGVRTGTEADEMITGATISDATLIIHPDSAHPQAGGKILDATLTDVTLHISPPDGVITHYTFTEGTPVPDKTGNTGSPAFEPMKTGLPTDIHIDPSTFYPQPGEPLSPPASPPKPEKDPAPAPSEPEHKKKKHHHHHHHRHHKH